MSDGREEQECGASPDDGATIVPGSGGPREGDHAGAGSGSGRGGNDGPGDPSRRAETPSAGDSPREDGAWDPNIAPDEGATLVPGGGSRGSDGGSGSGSGLGGSFSGSLSDRFEIVGPLGEGGMGVVYKARDLRLGREVALKRLKADSVESHRLIDRFEREARTVAGLEHPNIVRLYDVLDEPGGVVILMELLDGGSLQQRIDLEGALPVDEVVRIGVQLCEALEAAHARGIVHRDIKPGNVLLTRRGTPKLADFGLAVERTKEGDGRQTVTGSLLGTPHYAAPEQLIDGKGVDARADLYALGATLYAAATGTSPRAIRLDRVPESIRGVISKCLEERAADRYQSASEMAEALRETSGKASTARLPAELERLIDLALSDGVLTDEERTTLIRKAESLGLDGGEFGLVLDARVHASGARRQRSAAASAAAIGTCLQCGASNDSDVKFCGVCGADLFEKCPKCQRESRAGTKFCGGCGVEIEAAHEQKRAEAARRAEEAVVDLGSGVSMRLIEIKPGRFMMGSPAGEPNREDGETLHEVTITKAFWLGQTPVTQAQWQAVMGSNPSHFKGNPNHPVEMVSWDDAQEFCQRISQKTGMTFRLPTEAEWEYACRAGTSTAYSFGNDPGMLVEHAWFASNSGKETFDADAMVEKGDEDALREKLKSNECSTKPVATRKPNPWGLFDMHGNVFEWCSDWLGEYPSGAATDPQGPRSGSYRVLRGGCWLYGSQFCRAAFRVVLDPVYRDFFLGFRVARTP